MEAIDGAERIEQLAVRPRGLSHEQLERRRRGAVVGGHGRERRVHIAQT
jgi:hypothetical protein